MKEDLNNLEKMEAFIEKQLRHTIFNININ